MADTNLIRPARPEDAAAIADIQVDSYRSAYAGIFPQDHMVAAPGWPPLDLGQQP